MGNGISVDQGNYTTYGLRDVARSTDEQRQHDWSIPEEEIELDGAPNNKELNSLSTSKQSQNRHNSLYKGALDTPFPFHIPLGVKCSVLR